MKWSMATVGVIVLGLIGVAVILLFQNLTTSSENDYYLLKEITESAMFDSIDISYYRETGNVKIIREKFVENFTRRYAESTLFIGGKYIISFSDILEEPPKVSLIVNTDILNYRIYDASTEADYSVYNNLTGIFEYTGKKDKNVYSRKKTFTKTYYSMPQPSNDGTVSNVNQPFNIPSEISQKQIKPGTINIKFKNIRASNKIDDILQAKLNREIDWVIADKENNTNYYEVINSNDYASSCTVNDISFYDCKNNKGTRNTGMRCDQYNTFWLHWDGKCNSGNKVLLIFDAEFEYQEYEY